MSYATKQPSRKAYAPLKLILLVEDDTANATCITQIISQETPYHVFLATNSRRALEVIKHLKPQLFILDYRLPGMDGIELYDQLHAITGLEHIPAIILTACVEECENAIEARKLIAFRKPFDIDDFLYTIEEMLAWSADYSSPQPVLIV